MNHPTGGKSIRMRYRTLFTLLAVAATSLSCSLFSGAGAGGDTSLFNGRDLDDWGYHLVDPDVKMEDVWSVQDGLLVCKGEPLGYIYTKKSYTSFKLVVEWRWAPGTKPGNSGVLIRINGEPRGIPRSIEAQLASGSAGDLYGFHGMKINGDAGRFRSGKNDAIGEYTGVGGMTKAEKEPGEWNVYEITADGSRVTAFVNGTKVNEAHDCDVVSGTIGLQSEGGEIHFRQVVMKPID